MRAMSAVGTAAAAPETRLLGATCRRRILAKSAFWVYDEVTENSMQRRLETQRAPRPGGSRRASSVSDQAPTAKRTKRVTTVPASLRGVTHGLLVLPDSGLVDEDGVLEETANAALDDARDGALGLALLLGSGLGDALLVVDDVGGNLVARHPLGRHGRDLHGDLVRERLVTLVLDEHTHLRGQVSGTAVQVEVGVSVEQRGVGHRDVLADLGAQFGNGVGDLRTRGQDGLIGAGDVGGLGSEHSRDDFVGEADELGVLGDEVGLGSELDQGAVAARDDAVGGLAVSALGLLRETRDAQELDGLVEVALGLGERLLALHHAGAGGVAELLHISGSDSHISLVLIWVEGVSVGGVGVVSLGLVSLGLVSLGRGDLSLSDLGLGGNLGLDGVSLDRSSSLIVGAEQLALPIGHGLSLDLVAGAAGGALHEAFGHGVGDDAGQQRDGADGVVVARDRVVDVVRVAVGVEDADDRDAQLLGFVDREVFLLGVDDPDGRRGALHVADAAEGLLELGALEVREHTAEPTLVDVGLTHALSLLSDGFLGLLLGADEEDRAAVGHGLLDEFEGVVDVAQRLLQVDDVDAVALGEDEALHLRVPTTGLVMRQAAAPTEVGPRGGRVRRMRCQPMRVASSILDRHAPARQSWPLLHRQEPGWEKALGAHTSEDMRTLALALLILGLLVAPAHAADFELTAPLPGRVVRAFDEVGRYEAGHRGVDLIGTPGDTVVAAARGTVHFAGRVAGHGVVSIDHGNGWRTTYQPVTPAVAEGDKVDAGETIGRLEAGHCLLGCLHWGLTDATSYADPTKYLVTPIVRLLPVGSAPSPASAAGCRAGRRERRPSVEGRHTSLFGMRTHPITGVRKLHEGTDIAAPCGTPIVVPTAGRVTRTSYSSAYGSRVFVDHGDGVVMSYNHLPRLDVQEDARLEAGDQLGTVGNTGLSTGCHLHWMAWRNGVLVDPLRLVEHS